MAEFPEWAREHARKLHEFASQARSCEEEHGWCVDGAVTSIQLDGLARIFVVQMEEYVNANRGDLK